MLQNNVIMLFNLLHKWSGYITIVKMSGVQIKEMIS